MTSHSLPVAVIGSGPVGLAAAAHLVDRGLDPVVLEAGDDVAAGVVSWGHVQLFTPWKFATDPAAVALLGAAGWQPLADDEAHPTGAELRERYLLPLAAVPALRDRIRTGHRVLAVTRQATDKMKDIGRAVAPFELVVATRDGVERLLASAVIDASGTLGEHNPLGSSGVHAVGERESADRISYGLPDTLAQPERFGGKRVLVVGAGHSAMNVLADLVKLREGHPDTKIHWAVRRQPGEELFGGGDADGLPARAALGSAVQRMADAGALTIHYGVRIDAIDKTDEGLTVRHAGGAIGPVDEIVAATGFRPDLAMLREIRLEIDPSTEAPRTLAPLIDPNIHSCGSVPPHGERELAHPEPGFYLAGMKSYGRAPTFLMLTGYEQVRSIAAALAGDREAADRVELLLPETGVCKAPPNAEGIAAGACCSTPAPAQELPIAVSEGSSCCSTSAVEERDETTVPTGA